MEQSRAELSLEAGVRPSFSFVIITHEREQFFRESVESVEKAVAAYPGEAEIIAVDSSRPSVLGATSEDVIGLHVPDADKVHEKRNLGLHAASNDWVVYVDDDCTVAERTLSVLASAIDDAGDSVAGFYPVTEFVGEQKLAFECCDGTPFLRHFEKARWEKNLIWGPGTMAVFAREALLTVDGFDESFASAMGGEDIDIGLRLTERGYRLVGVPETLVYHTTATWNSFWGNCRRFYEYGRAEAEVLRKHPDRSHFKLNAVSPLLIVTVVSTVLVSVAWGSVGLLFLPLFAGYSTAITTANYRRKHSKPYVQALLLRVYDYATAAGIFENSSGPIPSNFFRLKPNLEPDAPYPLGRESIVYPGEILDYLAVSLAFLTMYLLTTI